MNYRYRLHDVDGEGVGEIHLSRLVDVGQKIPVGQGRTLRVLSIVPLRREKTIYFGLLTVEPV